MLKEVALSRYRCANGILETRTKDGSTAAKPTDPRTNPKANEAPTAPKPHTNPNHSQTPCPSTPSSSSGFTPSSILPFFFTVSAISTKPGNKLSTSNDSSAVVYKISQIISQMHFSPTNTILQFSLCSYDVPVGT